MVEVGLALEIISSRACPNSFSTFLISLTKGILLTIITDCGDGDPTTMEEVLLFPMSLPAAAAALISP